MQRIRSAPYQGSVTLSILFFTIFLILNPALLQSFQMSTNDIMKNNFSLNLGNRPYWYGGACSNDTQALQNSGARTFIDVRAQYVKAFLAFWVSESFSNDLWAQVGYYIYGNSVPVGFYQVWNMTHLKEISSGVTYLTSGTHSFSFVLGSDGRLSFDVDGSSFGYYRTGKARSSGGSPLCSLSEEGYSNAPFSFSAVTFKVAMQVMRSGIWSNVSFGCSFGTSWGVQGRVQNSTLLPNEIVVGSNLNVLRSSSPLWS